MVHMILLYNVRLLSSLTPVIWNPMDNILVLNKLENRIKCLLPVLFLIFSVFSSGYANAQTTLETPNGFTRPLPKVWPDWVKVPEINNPIYVCNNGDDDGSGTESDPYQSIEKAISVYKQGKAVLLCRGGEWTIDNIRFVGNRFTEYAYLGSYGSGAKPSITFPDGGIFMEGVDHLYFHDIKFTGGGYGITKSEFARVWDGINYVVFNDVEITEFALGFNISEGRIENGVNNTHFAVVNSVGYWNRSGFIFGGVSDHTFIDGNTAMNNGGFGGAHNYYLAGHWKTDTKNYVFQRNKSYSNAPRNGKDGGGCSRGAIVVHGYIENLFFVDNVIEEEKGTSELGCWGFPVDDGRLDSWGTESFPNLTYTGNVGKYTGNLLMGITSSDDALVGWNEGTLEAEKDAIGFAAPNKENGSTPINKITVVHNKFRVEGSVRNQSTGIKINVPDVVLEHNEVTYEDPKVKCYVVNGTELNGGSLGSNTCVQITP